MKSILLVTNIFPPDIGGPATYIDRLAHALAQTGWRVTVICASAPNAGNQDLKRPFRVRRIPWGRRAFRLRFPSLLCWEMPRHQLVLTNGFEYWTSLAARLTRRPYAVKIVGDLVWETARNLNLTTLDIDAFQQQPTRHPTLDTLSRQRQQYLRYTSCVITPSHYLQQLVSGWGCPKEKIHVIPNGITTAEYERILVRKRAATEPLRVAFCGRLTNWKGVDTLLSAIETLPNVRVDIIGDGPEESKLRAQTRQLNLQNRVSFCGRLDPMATRDRLTQAHALVLDSLYEGLSHTLIEASALGLARIASTCGGNPEIIRDGETGLLVKPGDISALRQAITRLLDEPYRFRLATNAKTESKKFDFSETVKHTLKLLEQNV